MTSYVITLLKFMVVLVVITGMVPGAPGPIPLDWNWDWRRGYRLYKPYIPRYHVESSRAKLNDSCLFKLRHHFTSQNNKAWPSSPVHRLQPPHLPKAPYPNEVSITLSMQYYLPVMPILDGM